MGLFDDDHPDVVKHYGADTSPCVWCGAQDPDGIMRGVKGGKTEHPPKVGDAAVCERCDGVTVLGSNGKWRKPTESEWRDLNRDEALSAARQEIAKRAKKRVLSSGWRADSDDTTTD